MSCNGILRKGETACFTCGDPAPGHKTKKPFAQQFALFITITFFASLLLTAASFFTDRTPPFTACLAASIILLFVKRSADQVAGRRT